MNHLIDHYLIPFLIEEYIQTRIRHEENERWLKTLPLHKDRQSSHKEPVSMGALLVEMLRKGVGNLASRGST